jgi:ribosome-binding protein aMBF1 (putative translation factor)
MTPHEALALLDDLIAAEAAHKAARERVKERAGDIFKTTRAALGDITRRELARRLGVDFTYVSKMENGDVEPRRPIVGKMAGLLRGKVE